MSSPDLAATQTSRGVPLALAVTYVFSAGLFLISRYFETMFADHGTHVPAATRALLFFGCNPLLAFLPPAFISLLLLGHLEHPSPRASAAVLGALVYCAVGFVVALVLLLLPLFKIVPL